MIKMFYPSSATFSVRNSNVILRGTDGDNGLNDLGGAKWVHRPGQPGPPAGLSVQRDEVYIIKLRDDRSGIDSI